MAAKTEKETKASAGPAENKAAAGEPAESTAATKGGLLKSTAFSGEASEAQREADDRGVSARMASADSVRRYSVAPAKAYGESTKEEHRKSGYILPDSFYEPDPPALAAHKQTGTERGMKHTPRDKEEK